MDFVSEIHYTVPEKQLFPILQIMGIPIDYHCYYIVSYKELPQWPGLKFVIVMPYNEVKCNAYGTVDEFNPYNLVKYYRALNLKEAKIIFPEMEFTEKNYGFKKFITPEDF